MPVRKLLATTAALAIALPALAQDRAQPATEPAAAPAQASPATGNTVAPATRPQPSRPVGGTVDSDTGLVDLSPEELLRLLEPPPPPVEVPAHARRSPWRVGVFDSVAYGFGEEPWGAASGAFLSTLMRRTDTPLASRWAHIALRNALLLKARAPRNVNPVDWTAERAWLLLRMGEADAARMLVAGVDVDRFSPKMFQVAVQTALANGDPPALCPLEDGIRKVEPRVMPLIEAMCASLAGEPESAAAQIDAARRRGRVGGIDLVLAQKVVGAGADTGRAVTVEWDPVERLNSWRFGLATATGMAPPDRLIRAASPQVRAWQARSPLLSAAQRLESARIATGLGVLSSQALIDIYSAIYDATDPDELPQTDAWQLRLAYVGKDRDTRVAAIRRLWAIGDGDLDKEAMRALTGRAASRIVPDPELQEDAPNLIAAMLAAGLDRQAGRWTNAVRRMDDRFADRSWAMLALGVPDPRGLDLSVGRINAFIGRDDSKRKMRGAMLVAGLAALGRIDGDTADRLNRRHGLGIGHKSRWTRLIDGSAALGQGASVAILTGAGFQTPTFDSLPPAHLFHAVAALNRTGQGFLARMIAAEALART